MEFGTLTASISELWAFIWPPVLNLAVIVLTVRMVAPSGFEAMTKILGDRLRLLAYFLKENETIEEVGIKKLIPTVSLFVLVFVLYVSNSLSFQLGYVIPGEITYNPASLLISNAGGSEKLKLIISKYPNIREAHDLSLVVDSLNEQATAVDENLFGYAQWEDRITKYSRIIYYAKFYIFLSTVLLLIEVGLFRGKYKSFRSALLVTTVAVCVLGFAGYRLLYSYEQMMFGKLTAAHSQLLLDSARAVETNGLDQRIENVVKRYEGENWWNISF